MGLAILWLDIGGVGTSLSRSLHPVLPALMMVVPLALTFAAAVTAFHLTNPIARASVTMAELSALRIAPVAMAAE